jgi:PQQ-dependent dehydrogenase (s-GDH family)
MKLFLLSFFFSLNPYIQQIKAQSFNTGWSQTTFYGGAGDNSVVEGSNVAANVTNRFRSPFDIKFNPAATELWVSEKKGGLSKVNINTGIRTKLRFSDGLTAANAPYTFAIGDLNTYFGGAQGNSNADIIDRWATNADQGGFTGFDFDPNFATNYYVYVAYAYLDGSNNRKTRIARYTYDAVANTLNSPFTLIENMPNSNDHNSGRVLIGPLTVPAAQRKLFYTMGDQGANQFINVCDRIRSLDLPTAAEIAAENYTKYQGKVLRINLDGSIPTDNPSFQAIDNFVPNTLPANAAVRSHIYSYGHRNAQGLTFSPYNETLYSCEQGPRTDDEVNIINAGGNYGWPWVSGAKDNNSTNTSYQYIDWSSGSGAPAAFCSSGSGYVDSKVPGDAGVHTVAPIYYENDYMQTIEAPIYRTTTTATSWTGLPTTFLNYPTWAMSSVKYYKAIPSGKIPGYDSSLIVSSLKKGALYRLKLNAAGDDVVGDSVHIAITGNRFRDFAISPNGLNIYVLTDSSGQTSGPTSGSTTALLNRGAILRLSYSGVILNFNDRQNTPNNTNLADAITMYPSPAVQKVTFNYPTIANNIFTINVIALNGKQMLTQRINNNQQIDVSAFAPGVYQVLFYDEKGVMRAVKKLIKQ